MKTQTQSATKGKKGTVSIENLEDRGLRLRWRHEGNRYVLALGIPDSKLNRSVAPNKARQIEGDIATNNSDGTLEMYRPAKTVPKIRLTVPNLFESFIDHRRARMTEKTITAVLSSMKYT